MKRRNVFIIILLLIIAAIVLFNIFEKDQDDTLSVTSSPPPAQPIKQSPQFIDEGDLYFIKDKDTLTMIDIELAETKAERAKGMMYRTSLKNDGGMLFIFDKEEAQSFWMKNTYITLDLIFINKQQIVEQIAQSASPSSEGQISCSKPVKYVLEVNGGFTAAFGIEAGQSVTWAFVK